MIEALLRSEKVGASFGARRVFASVSFCLAAGAYALRGPNGIGKSTLLRVLAGAQKADGGRIWLDGKSLQQAPLAAKRWLSYVPDEGGIYPFMTGQDLLDFVSSAKQARIDEAIERIIGGFDLRHQLPVRFDAMSFGTQKKMMLCAAFVGAPRVMLLDEPSNGIDISSRLRLEEMIRAWSKDNLVLVSTHDDDFAAAIAASSISMQKLISAGSGSDASAAPPGECAAPRSS